MLEGSESPKGPHKLLQTENVSISAFYTVIQGEMIPSVKTGQFVPWTYRPLIRATIYQQVMLLKGSEYPISPQ